MGMWKVLGNMKRTPVWVRIMMSMSRSLAWVIVHFYIQVGWTIEYVSKISGVRSEVLLVGYTVSVSKEGGVGSTISSPDVNLLSVTSMLGVRKCSMGVLSFFISRVAKGRFMSVLGSFGPTMVKFSMCAEAIPFLSGLARVLEGVKCGKGVVTNNPRTDFYRSSVLRGCRMSCIVSNSKSFAFLGLVSRVYCKCPVAGVGNISCEGSGSVYVGPPSKRVSVLSTLPLRPVSLMSMDGCSSPFSVVADEKYPKGYVCYTSETLRKEGCQVQDTSGVVYSLVCVSEGLGRIAFLVLSSAFATSMGEFVGFTEFVEGDAVPFRFHVSSEKSMLGCSVLGALGSVGYGVIRMKVSDKSRGMVSRVNGGVSLSDAVGGLCRNCSLKVRVITDFVVKRCYSASRAMSSDLTLVGQLATSKVSISMTSLAPFPKAPLCGGHSGLSLVVRTGA